MPARRARRHGPAGPGEAPSAGPGLVCPDKNLLYWQAFAPGGESDLSARHQQVVLKKKCAAIETIVQYKAGAGGGLMWAQMNSLPGDGLNVVGINLPYIVFQPIEGEVLYKTADITPDVLVMPDKSPTQSVACKDGCRVKPGMTNSCSKNADVPGPCCVASLQGCIRITTAQFRTETP